MQRVRVVNESRGAALAERAEVAESFLARGRGLMGRRDWSQADGLVIVPCNSIHCWFMRLPLDIAYVDKQHVIRRLLRSIKPWRVGPIVLQSHYVVELPAGTLARTGSEVGDHLVLEPMAG